MIDQLKEQIQMYVPLIIILFLTVISYMVRSNGETIHDHCIWSNENENKEEGATFINIDKSKGDCPSKLKWPNNIKFITSDTKHKSEMWSSIFLRISNFISIIAIIILISIIINKKNPGSVDASGYGQYGQPGYGQPGYGPPGY